MKTMPKRSSAYKSKRRGVRKQQSKVVVIHGEETSLNNNGSEDFYSAITAQTATNLKAFRSLFGSHEETEEEFLGYYPKETSAIQSNCKKKTRKLKKEILSLQAALIHTMTSYDSQTSPIPSPSSCVFKSLSPKGKVISVSETIPNSKSAAPDRPEETFLGFTDTDPLREACRIKSSKLFSCCEGLGLNRHRTLDTSSNPKRDHPKASTGGKDYTSGTGFRGNRTILKKGGKRKQVASSDNGSRVEEVVNPVPGLISCSSGNKYSVMDLKEFVQTHPIAGEITVTPILQSDSPLPVKVRCDSPILINCLRKL